MLLFVVVVVVSLEKRKLGWCVIATAKNTAEETVPSFTCHPSTHTADTAVAFSFAVSFSIFFENETVPRVDQHACRHRSTLYGLHRQPLRLTM